METVHVLRVRESDAVEGPARRGPHLEAFVGDRDEGRATIGAIDRPHAQPCLFEAVDERSDGGRVPVQARTIRTMGSGPFAATIIARTSYRAKDRPSGRNVELR